VVLPLAFATVVTVYASFLKIFSTVPAVGYFAQHNAHKGALERGETSFGSAKNVEAMEAVVRNTGVQGWLSVIFLVLSVIVIIAAIIATIRAYPNGGGKNTEDPEIPSRIYAPAGLVSSPAEKELEKAWKQVAPEHRIARGGH